MKAVAVALRLCFIGLFGAMSLMHGPIMAYGGHGFSSAAHQVLAAVLSEARSEGDAMAHHGHHKQDAPAPGHVRCNSFTCFLAVEPTPVLTRPLHAALFGLMTAMPMPALEPIRAQPDLPPPRLQS